MNTESRFPVTPRLILGLGIALLGFSLVLDRLYIIEAGRFLRFWPVGLMIIGGLMIVQNGGQQRTVGVIITAVGTWIFLNLQGVITVSIWRLFWPIVLIFIGLSMATRPSRHPGRRRHRSKPWEDPSGGTGPFGPTDSSGGSATEVPFVSEPASGSSPSSAVGGSNTFGAASSYAFGVDNSPHISMFSVMSGVKRASNAAPFRGADITALMGGANLDLRLAVIPPGGEAVLDITTIMGGVEIVVPSTWVVSTPIFPFMGSIEDKRLPPLPVDGKMPVPDAQTPRLVINGFVMMGSVELKS
jgi:predicted membrane protein